MSDSPEPPASAPTSNTPIAAHAGDLPLVSATTVHSSPLVRLGGVLGIVGCVLGLVLLVVGCSGFAKALALSPAAVGLGLIGLLIVLVGALSQRRRIGEDTHVLQALFACGLSILGGLLEMAIWLRWPIFK